MGSSDSRGAVPELPDSRAAEEALLASSRHVEPGVDVSDVVLEGERSLHTLKSTRKGGDSVGAESDLPVVWLPGFGTGAALTTFPWRNLTQFRHYAVDPLGTGLSSRPEWTAKNPEEAEAFFVDALEEWRKIQDLPRFHLVGHSLGGFLAACYAERFPDRVDRLVLLSPVGVPKKPEGWDEQERPLVWSLAMSAWNSGWTPQGLCKTPLLGKWIVDSYVTKRFRDEEWIDKPRLIEYLHRTWTEGETSGEEALNGILSPGAWARQPLQDRIPKLRVGSIHFVYGEKDWMDPKPAFELQQDRGGPEITIGFVQRAGHQLLVENPQGTAEEVAKALAKTAEAD